MKKKVMFLLSIVCLFVITLLGINSNYETVITSAANIFKWGNWGSSSTFNHIDIEAAASFTYFVDGKEVNVDINFYNNQEELSKINIYRKNLDGSLTEIEVDGNWQNQSNSSSKEYRISGTFDRYYTDTTTEVVYVVQFTLLVDVNGEEQELIYTEEYSYSSSNNVCPGGGNSKGIDVEITGEKLESFFSSSLKITKNVLNADDGTFTFEVINEELNFEKEVQITTEDGTGFVTIGGLKPGEVYTISEINIPDGYELVEDNPVTVTAIEKKTVEVTFTNRKETTSVSVSKVWDDANIQGAIRPDSIVVSLFSNGTDTGKTVTLSESNGWSGKFTDLEKYNNESLIEYTVVENTVNGYTSVVTGSVDEGYTITNKPILINSEDDDNGNDGLLIVSKVWNDNDDKYQNRPDSIVVKLFANGVDTGKIVTLNESNSWSGSFTNLYKFDKNGNEVKYTVEELTVTGYDVDIVGSKDTKYVFTITNKLILINEDDGDATNDGKITVNKIWNDNNNQDGKRPENITINLLANGNVIQTITLSNENGWTYTFESLPEYINGEKVNYTVLENTISSYTVSYTGSVSEGFTITNTHEPELINNDDDDDANDGKITVSKVWNDNENQDGKRPKDITVNLLADGEVTHTIALNDENDWTYTFEGLYKYANGVEIVYTIEEVSVEGYTSVINGNISNGFVITNTHEPELINNDDDDTTNDGKITVSKVWNDNENQDNIRPNEINVSLYANDEVIQTIALNDANKWTYTFEGLYKYANGKEINYRVEENTVSGYTVSYVGSVSKGFTITNTHEVDLYNGDGELTVTKEWEDANNQDGKRPKDITINLLADGEVIQTIVLNDANDWTYTFTELEKNANGEEVIYTIEEVSVEGYDSLVGEIRDGEVTITNTHEPELINEDDENPDNNGKITVSKVWNDNENQDGKRPENITINLFANDEVTQTIVLNDANDWTYTFEGLYKYANGKEITYDVREEVVEGYTVSYVGSVSKGFTITNSYTPELTSIVGKKIWNDYNNQDGKRPDSITIKLYADGEEVELESNSITGDKNSNEWAYMFTNLPKYNNGFEITYTVEEVSVDGYATTYSEDDPYVIINTHNIEKTTISGTKTWDDNNNQDGKRPESITVKLYADGEVIDTKVVSATDGWTYEFADLDVYKEGKIISYTIGEDVVEGYTTEIDGYNIVNIHTPEKITISGTKTWDDNNNQDGKRPESITVNLLADGEVIDTKVVSATDGWTYEFADLDKYVSGREIVYTLTEGTVDGYEPIIDGFNITNTHEIEKITFKATKYWDDNDDQDGIRVKEISVTLFKNDTKFLTVSINESNNWTYEFTDLDRYENGIEIEYSIVEDYVFGYESNVNVSEIDDNNIISAVITNTHEPELINEDDENPDNNGKITVSKVWNDNENQDGIRPDSIIVNLLANGNVIQTITLSNENGWTYTFEGLYKYANGIEIIYTIEEVNVEGYTSVIKGNISNGFVITNTHEPELINEDDENPDNNGKITVSKVWNDNENQDGIRPDSIIVNLLANGEVTQTIVLNDENDWTYTFEGLYKYANGEEVTYTIEEVSVEGYTSVISGNVSDGFVITNTHEPEVISIVIKKTWEDYNDIENVRPDSIKVQLYANGVYVTTVVISSEDEWVFEITDLYKYANGEEVIYTIIEESVSRYITTYDGYDIINTLDLGKGDGITPPQTGIDESNNNNIVLYIVMIISSLIILFRRKTISSK